MVIHISAFRDYAMSMHKVSAYSDLTSWLALVRFSLVRFSFHIPHGKLYGAPLRNQDNLSISSSHGLITSCK